MSMRDGLKPWVDEDGGAGGGEGGASSGAWMPAGVVQVLAEDGRVTGAGFLAAGDVVVTCAHVVRAAGSGSGRPVMVRFPHLPGRPTVEGVALAEAWRAPEAEDVAAIRLAQGPDDARRAPLGSAAGCGGHRISSFGFPAQAPDGGHYGYGTAGNLLPGDRVGTLLQLTGANDLTTGFSGGPVMDLVTGLVVGMVTAISPADHYRRGAGIAYATPVEVLREVVPGLAEQQVAPYRGLEPFTERDVGWFHGRQAVVNRVLERLRQHRLVLLLGPSGAGKSSLVRAGVIPVLAEGGLPGSEGWARVVARPGVNLLAELEKAGLDGAAVEGIGPAVARRLAAEPGQGRLLVVIDQFEELLTQPAAPARPGAGPAAVDDLLAVLEAHPTVSILLAARNDFYPRLAEACPQLLEAATPGLVNLPGDLAAPDLHAIITRPAHDAGARFEDGLPERIIEDLRATDSSGRVPATLLPPLQLALVQLWNHRADGRLTHQAYQRIGEATGALTAWCDNALNALPAGHQPSAQRLLTALVRPADDVHGIPATRHHVPLVRLRALTAAAQHTGIAPTSDRVFDQVVAALSRDRIITTTTSPQPDGHPGEPTAELIHDALIRDWITLRDWIARDQRFQTWLHRVTEQHRRHCESNLSADLLSGTTLAEGRDWATQRTLPAEITDFLSASERHQHATARRTRRLNTILATLLVLALIATGLVFWQQQETDNARNEAVAARSEAQSRQLAAQSQALIDSNSDLASLMAVSAYRTSPTAEARVSLLQAADRKLIGLLTTQQEDPVYSVAFSPDGDTLASAGSSLDGEEGEVRLWDTRTGQPLGGPLTHDGEVYSVAFSPDGSTLASAGSSLDGEKGEVRLWDTRTGQPLGGPLTHDGEMPSVAFHPDGSTLASVTIGGWDSEVRLWDTRTGQPQSDPLEHDSWVSSVAFSPDGGTLASVSSSLDGEEGEVRLWDTRTGQPLGDPLEHDSRVSSVAFHPDGGILAGASYNGTVRLWDTRTGQPLGDPFKHDGGVSSVAFHPDGSILASAGSSLDGEEGEVRLWDTRTGQPLGDPFKHDSRVSSVAFHPDGGILAGASYNGTVRLWDTQGGQSLGDPFKHDGGVSSVAFSPDGGILAGASYDGTVRLWDAGTGQPLGDPLRHATESRVYSVAFHPDGDILASASYDGTVRLWDAGTGQPLGDPLRHATESLVYSVAFHPDGDILASAGDDGTVRLWDTQGGQSRGEPFTHDGGVYSVAFSPDGSILASAGDDGTVRLWDTRGGQSRGEPFTHDGGVYSVAFSPDGGTLAFASTRDGEHSEVRLWNVAFPDPDQAVEQICRALGRDFTEIERSQYLQGLPADPVCP
ncbi:trypsin-like peptidase domain-containing protein [Streptomyces harbinensis]|uniref:nSTAND1 domain-containing NTPase n=1 Tax=Streptomyces harbinensis TaxID=1176198 RepID=UPI00370F9170